MLIPGIGREVNGSIRWLVLGPVALQVSELAKLAVVIFLAGYLTTHQQEVRVAPRGFIKPMIIFSLMAFLLLLEPDFGATVVIFCTVLGMLFLAGVQLRYFLFLILISGLAFGSLAVLSPYRLQRLTTFLHPWANQYGSGYQLTQSHIAFGKGGWFGVGLGDSVQKLFYLPEAHTDFLFAVLGEELGLVGLLTVLLLFIIFISRGFKISSNEFKNKNYFPAYLAFGLSLWIGLQALINMGVNLGALPTKGLTLPFISYGGSSMLINCLVLGLLLRIDHEARLQRPSRR